MTFQGFANELKEKVVEYLGEEYRDRVTLQSTHSGAENDALAIIPRTGQHSKTAAIPVLIISELYEACVNKHVTVDFLAKQIVNEYRERILPQTETCTDRLSQFFQWETVKKYIRTALVNYENNKDTLLKHYVFSRYLDLAKVYYFKIPKKYCSIPVSNGPYIFVEQNYIDDWGVELAQIDEVAMNNNKKYLEPQLTSLEVFLNLPVKIPMYCILTNERRELGAACMMYAYDLLDSLAEKSGCDLYIFPSSVHEVLVRPVTHEDTDEMCNAFVREQTRDKSKKELLADHAYKYLKEKKEIVCV